MRRWGKQNGSFGWTSAVWTAISAVGAVAGVISSADTARRTGNMAKDAAKANAMAADQAMNRANQKSPDTAAAMAANVLSGKAGQSGTMLTGAQGVDPNSLTLGKTTLLGG